MAELPKEFIDKIYQQGRADKYQEITSEYILLTEKQVAEIRADAIDEFIKIFWQSEIEFRPSQINEIISIAERLKEKNNE